MATILVIDDSMMVRQQVGRTLRDGGFAIVEAADGNEALERVRENAEVALAICDVNMPGMNGLEFLEQVRVLAPALPVVMLTTEGQVALIQRAKSLGAKGWVVKPFRAEILLATARKLAGVPDAS
jgi:two-component system chemotaxis response regulator CheY